MNDYVYRDFDITLSPADLDDTATPALPCLHVTLTHRPSGETQRFELRGVLGGMDQLLETHVRLRFPGSGAAMQLERQAGEVLHRLNRNWRQGLARKVGLALMSLCDGPGAAFWWHQLQSMPRVVLHMMFKRTEELFEPLAGVHPLKDFSSALRGAWTEVLTDASGLDGWRDVQLTALARKGWPVADLDSRTHAQLSAISERARLASMALGYLSDHDWQQMLGFVLESRRRPDASGADAARGRTEIRIPDGA